MSLKSLLHKIPYFLHQSTVLVCETDGFEFRGTVISRNGKSLKCDFFAKSQALELDDAVKRVLENLRTQGWQGREAVLMTPAVLASIVTLPISPKQVSSPSQMQELIRWELEPLIMRHTSKSAIGQILMQMGVMTEAQVNEVITEQKAKQKHAAAHGHNPIYANKRFGDLAIELGFVNKLQLEDAIARQLWLKPINDDVLYGWAKTALTNANDDANNNAASTQWLVSGVNMGNIRQWEAAFLGHKVTLKEVFPLVGCASTILPTDDEVLLLEYARDHLAGIQLSSGKLANIEYVNRIGLSELDYCLETYHQFIQPSVKQVWLASNNVDAQAIDFEPIAMQLSGLVGREVKSIPLLAPNVSAGAHGVAKLLLHTKTNSNIASITVGEPKQSLLKRVEVRAILAGLAILLLIIGMEIGLYISKSIAQGAYNKVAEEKKTFDTIFAVAQKKVDNVTALQKNIKTNKNLLNTTIERNNFFASELPIRERFVQQLLDNLSYAITEDVVVNQIDETPNQGIRFSAWALSERSAQQFIQSYKNLMAPLGMELTDPIVRSQPGRLGLQGYDIQFRLINTLDMTLTDAAQASNAAGSPVSSTAARKP